jgi:transcriptional regulator with XRE-family HTH domain
MIGVFGGCDMAELCRRIGVRISQLRKAAGLTQEDLADRLGFATYRYVSRIECGDTDLRAESIGRIADALGVKPYELFMFDAPTTPAPRKPMKELLREADDQVRPLAIELVGAIVRWSRARRRRR